MKKFYEIYIPNEEKYFGSFDIQVSDTIADNILNKEELQVLETLKCKIDEKEYNKEWDNFKKYSNDYELINVSNVKKNNDSIAKYFPLSRSYFKLWEIINDFNLLNFNHPITTTSIAEGPGGFIEAIINMRRKDYYKKDKLYGITLKSTQKDIPGWNKSDYFLKCNKNISVLYGNDDTGNIYNLDNILDFRNKIGFNSCHIVTADGGFDFSIDFNKQEQLSYKIIFCQILINLSIQKIKGHFICKFFDLQSIFTVKLLWLLNCCYEKIIITKPQTSRPANSEKYIIAYHFLGFNDIYLHQLYNILHKWNTLPDNKFVIDIFNYPPPDTYFTKIEEYNKYLILLQVKTILNTLHLIKHKMDYEKIKEIIKYQTQKAIEWCKMYNIDINYNSKYIT